MWQDMDRHICGQDVYLHLSGVVIGWLWKVCQRSGCRLQRTSTLFPQLELKVLQEDLGTVIKTTFTSSQCAWHAGRGLALVALRFWAPSLFPTSDSFTTGRPWEKSLRRRNSSQFGQCKALKASSMVFWNAALTAVVTIFQKSQFPQPCCLGIRKQTPH